MRKENSDYWILTTDYRIHYPAATIQYDIN